MTGALGAARDPLDHAWVRRVAIAWGLIGAGFHLYLI